MVARQEDQTRLCGGYAMIDQDLDVGMLGDWMQTNVEEFEGPLTATKFAGGQSNPTYRLATPTRNYVLRRKPPGEILPGAHAVDREARIMSALSGTAFPVPRVYGLCLDSDVIGSPFFVMELIEGRIFWDCSFPGVLQAERPAYFEAMNGTLAQLHLFDPEAHGLADFGRPDNYVMRQITRWSRQYLADPEAGRDPHLDRLIEWLPEHVPAQPTAAILHGDFRCDNMIFHPTEPRVLGVIDWELATLGDPLADFCYHAMMYRMPPHIVAGLAGADLASLNIPSEEEYVASYCRKTGRTAIEHFDFYMAFNFFRLAAIFHGIKGRAIRGTASSAQARERAKVLPELAKLAWSQVRDR
jgi:aminoglycoside phosphotransferase (APT) family kinase protein